MWVPDDPAPQAQRRAGVQESRPADPSTRERNRGGDDGDPATGLGQRDQRLRITRLEEETHVDVSDATGRVEHLPSAEPLSEQQDPLALEIRHVDRRAPPETMPPGQRGQDSKRKQQATLEVIVAVTNRHGQVCLATLDAGERAHTPLLEETDVHLFSRLQISGQERSQHALDHLGRAGDAQAPDVAASHGVGVVDEPVDIGEQGTAAEEQTLTRAGHPSPAAHTLHEGHAQLLLEVANLAPQRRLRDPHLRGGSGEGAGVGDGNEGAEVTELHLVQCPVGILYRSWNALDSIPGTSVPSGSKGDPSC